MVDYQRIRKVLEQIEEECCDGLPRLREYTPAEVSLDRVRDMARNLAVAMDLQAIENCR